MTLKDKLTIGLIVLVVSLSLMTLFWSSFNSAIDREEIKLGLDLKGGALLVYQADFSKLPEGTSESEAISNTIKVLEKRINAYGVNEPVIKKSGSDRIRVELPGIANIDEAKRLIGETALIKFKTFTVSEQGDFAIRPNVEGGAELMAVDKGTGDYIATLVTGEVDGQPVDLTSQLFSEVYYWIPQSGGSVEIRFKWNSEGADLFYQVTSQLYTLPERSVERQLGIFLGDQLISAPQVNAAISDSGIIEGMKLNEAKDLTQLLNAGRIPVPLTTIEEDNVSPTLGKDFVDLSKKAGAVAVGIIILFMILYYRLPGVVAGLALLMYVALVMGLFKALGVTLTLAGIAGFVLSIGMAVDANVLIFERMREEMRMGRSIRASVEMGFNRAWPAIRDSNVTTLITCGVLYWVGSALTVPAVQGFAATLSIGVILSMFSALIITRTLLRFVGRSQAINDVTLFMSTTKEPVPSKEGR
ncbi:MAG: protein translocase subunit SecD [Dehalococcoidia bacterium]|nr:protein translocase subunit SecD [Dehalococcoidia bacterium]